MDISVNKAVVELSGKRYGRFSERSCGGTVNERYQRSGPELSETTRFSEGSYDGTGSKGVDTGSIVDKDTCTVVDKEKYMVLDKDTGSMVDKDTCTVVDKDTGRMTDKDTIRMANKDTGTMVDKDTDRALDKGTHRMTDRDASRMTNEDTGREMNKLEGLLCKGFFTVCHTVSTIVAVIR